MLIKITMQQMEQITELPNKSDKIIAFAMIYLSYLFSDENGEFNAKQLTLNRLTGISFKQIERVINKLIDIGYIECIYRNRLKQITYEKRKYVVSKFPNRYRLNLLESENAQMFFEFKKVNVNAESFLYYFWTCYSSYLSQLEINPTRREKDNIKIWIKNIAI